MRGHDSIFLFLPCRQVPLVSFSVLQDSVLAVSLLVDLQVHRRWFCETAESRTLSFKSCIKQNHLFFPASILAPDSITSSTVTYCIRIFFWNVLKWGPLWRSLKVSKFGFLSGQGEHLRAVEFPENFWNVSLWYSSVVKNRAE